MLYNYLLMKNIFCFSGSQPREDEHELGVLISLLRIFFCYVIVMAFAF